MGVFLACSPGGTSKFAKNSQPVSGFCFCLVNVLLPGLPLIKCDTKVCCFFIRLQRGPTNSDGASFLLWGQGEQSGGRLVLVDCNAPFTVQLLSLSAANCILYVAVVAYSSLHHITKSSACNTALTPFGSSETRPLMNSSRNNVGDRTPPCGTPCLSRIFLL